MQVIEISAKDVESAKKAAAEKLGVSADTLSITVLEETKGLFGKGNVKIRAEAPTAAAEASAEAPAKPKRGGRAAKAAPAPEAAPVDEHVAVVEMKEEAAAKPARRGRTSKAKPEEAAPAESAPTEERVDVVATDDDAKNLLKLLNGILDAGNLDVKATISGTAGRYVNLVIDGRDVGHLIGKQGEVINALQYLLNIVANQQIGNGVRATLDGNDYRTRREAALTKLATSIAEQVLQRGEEAVLDALPAFERRIVHKALSEYSGVSTYSEGEEPNRRVVIAPAD